jgi:H+/Cl- antiporter ClcA
VVFKTLYRDNCRVALRLLLPQVLGGGQDLVRFAEKASGGIMFIILLLVVKLLFTCVSFGSGASGGIFLPILSIGALTGSVFGLVPLH